MITPEIQDAVSVFTDDVWRAQWAGAAGEQRGSSSSPAGWDPAVMGARMTRDVCCLVSTGPASTDRCQVAGLL